MEKNEELLRWAAEEVLGWKRISGMDLGWRDANDDFLRPYDLTGWDGFALATEAAVKGDHLVTVGRKLTDGALWVAITGRMIVEEDPGIAAWKALWAAMND